MNELIEIKYTDPNKPTVSGRQLHERLEINSNYTTWMNRMISYGFEEGKDYKTRFPNLESKIHGGQNMQDHELTISMAKQICMIQRTPQGKACREYLISVEEAWNQPEAVMARALMMANKTLEGLKFENQKLLAANAQLTVTTETMRPKAEYFDDLVDRNMLTSIRDTAKELKVKEKIFVNFLLDKKYLYRDQKGKLTPTAGKGDGLFEVRESKNDKTKWAGVQTLVTAKGRETFRLLTEGLRYE